MSGNFVALEICHSMMSSQQRDKQTKWRWNVAEKCMLCNSVSYSIFWEVGQPEGLLVYILKGHINSRKVITTEFLKHYYTIT